MPSDQRRSLIEVTRESNTPLDEENKKNKGTLKSSYVLTRSETLELLLHGTMMK